MNLQFPVFVRIKADSISKLEGNWDPERDYPVLRIFEKTEEMLLPDQEGALLRVPRWAAHVSRVVFPPEIHERVLTLETQLRESNAVLRLVAKKLGMLKEDKKPSLVVPAGATIPKACE